MPIVQCDMCGDLHDLQDWKESNIFICIICANILSEIRKTEINLEKVGIKHSENFRLSLFDNMRKIERRKKFLIVDNNSSIKKTLKDTKESLIAGNV